MAKKKSSESKADKKEEQKKIPITFKPQFSAASHKTVNLKKAVTTLVDGAAQTEYLPMFENEPSTLTVNADEVVYISQELFEYLYEKGDIDTPEDIAERDRQRTLIGNQVGTNPKEFVTAKARTHLYTDGFVLADPESIQATRVKE